MEDFSKRVTAAIQAASDVLEDIMMPPQDTPSDSVSDPSTGSSPEMVEIPKDLYDRLCYLGIINANSRNYNVGESNYASKFIQPWSIWLDYPELTAWDDDIIKRTLRKKIEPGLSPRECRIKDYYKIKHNCDERIRQLQFPSLF